MRQASRRAGVCIIRVEAQESGALLITVVMNANIDDASAENSRQTPDVDTALAVVRGFLVDFTRGATA
jgi:hypothetical protein